MVAKRAGASRTKRCLRLISSQLLVVTLLGCGGDGADPGPTEPEAVVTTPEAVGPTPQPGGPSVLRFDGSDDRVTVPYSPTFGDYI